MKTTGAARRPRKKPAGAYHHGELRRALIDATLAIVRAEGTGAVSLSAAARRVGVSPQASYNHFGDKSELLAAAAEEAVRALGVEMQRARDAASGAGEKLEVTGVAYVRWAAAHPAQFRLLAAPELADKSAHPELARAYDAAFAVLRDAIAEAQRVGVARASDAKKLALTAWGLVHGVAWLFVDGQIEVATGERDAARVARDAVRVLFKGLRA